MRALTDWHSDGGRNCGQKLTSGGQTNLPHHQTMNVHLAALNPADLCLSRTKSIQHKYYFYVNAIMHPHLSTFSSFFVVQVSFIIVRVSSDHPVCMRGALLSPYQQKKKSKLPKIAPSCPSLCCQIFDSPAHGVHPFQNPAVADRSVLASNVHCSPSHGPPRRASRVHTIPNTYIVTSYGVVCFSFSILIRHFPLTPHRQSVPPAN